MFKTLRNAWKIEDLRKKMIFTLIIIVIFRLGVAMPVPFLDPSAISSMVNETGSMLGYINLLTGGAFSQATLFALSVQPYINASIIIQLLTVALPPLERLAQEGEEGRRKINRIPGTPARASRWRSPLPTTSCSRGRARWSTPPAGRHGLPAWSSFWPTPPVRC